MKFLVPNYSCLQNPWLGAYRLQIPVLFVLCPQLNLLNPPPRTKFLGTPLLCTWRYTGTMPIHSFQLKRARCSSQGFVSARHDTLPAAEIMRYDWLWNCARLWMQCSFRLWAINATQQVSVSPSLVRSVGASGSVYNRQLALWTGFHIWNISSSVRIGYRNDNMLCSIMIIIYPVIFLNRFSFFRRVR
jgi:hypothetical protein